MPIFNRELGDDPTIGHTHINGPTRQVPGTQHSKLPIPSVGEEPDWMRYSTVSPAPAGCALIRDIRAWHGPSANCMEQTRQAWCTCTLTSALCVCVCACVCVCVCVCVCGTALFAGGTPNLSNNVRAIPQSQFVPAWYRVRFTRTLPHELYTSLSLHAQKICREIVASPSGPAVPAAAYFRFPPDKENGTDPGQGQGGRLVVPKL